MCSTACHYCRACFKDIADGVARMITVVQFSLTKLVRSDDRRQVISGLQQRWQSFKGRS